MLRNSALVRYRKEDGYCVWQDPVDEAERHSTVGEAPLSYKKSLVGHNVCKVDGNFLLIPESLWGIMVTVLGQKLGQIWVQLLVVSCRSLGDHGPDTFS